MSLEVGGVDTSEYNNPISDRTMRSFTAETQRLRQGGGTGIFGKSITEQNVEVTPIEVPETSEQ